MATTRTVLRRSASRDEPVSRGLVGFSQVFVLAAHPEDAAEGSRVDQSSRSTYAAVRDQLVRLEEQTERDGAPYSLWQQGPQQQPPLYSQQTKMRLVR